MLKAYKSDIKQKASCSKQKYLLQEAKTIKSKFPRSRISAPRESFFFVVTAVYGY